MITRTMNRIFTSKNISRHKRRFDRGGVYLQYAMILITGGTFLKVFGFDEWWAYAIGIVLVVAIRYVSGFIDEKKGILKNEQEQYTRQNPAINELNSKLDEILKKLNT